MSTVMILPDFFSQNVSKAFCVTDTVGNTLLVNDRNNASCVSLWKWMPSGFPAQALFTNTSQPSICLDRSSS